MGNTKSVVIAPVLALAVCAIAMVGLGFALTTNVVSSENDTEILLVDLAKLESGLGTNAPNPTSSNEALNFGIKTEKNAAGVVSYTVEGGQAFLRIYGNLTGVTLKALVTGGNGITEVGLSLYSTTGTTGSLAIGEKVAELTVDATEDTFKQVGESSVASLTCGTYIIKITSIAGLVYDGSNWSSSNDPVTLTAVANEKLSYTFTAEGGNLPATP